MGVVAEAVRAARLEDDLAVPRAVGDDGCRIVGAAREDEDTAIEGAPVAVAAQFPREPRVVARVALLAAALRAGVMRRMHAGLAAERRDAKARIVGERGEPGGAARVACLGERVLDEGRVRLVGLAHAKLALR